MHHDYKTRGTCATNIHFDLENGIVRNIAFDGGCNGNLKAISKLLEGQSATFAIEALSGNTCGRRNTSCADQLAKALAQALEAQGM